MSQDQYEVVERIYSWGMHVVLFKNGRMSMFVDVYNDGHYSVHDAKSWR